MRVLLLVLAVMVFMSTFAFADDVSYEKAFASYKKGDYKTAVKLLKEYVEKKPDPNAYYLLGYASYKMKNHSESVKYFKEAYVIDPNFSP
jgi:TolA-binding protein